MDGTNPNMRQSPHSQNENHTRVGQSSTLSPTVRVILAQQINVVIIAQASPRLDISAEQKEWWKDLASSFELVVHS